MTPHPSPVSAASGRLDVARSLGPFLAERSDEIEGRRRLPEEVVAALADSGVFRLWLPERYGGDEATVLDGLRVIEELAYWDGSSGWCAMIAATTATLAGFLPAERAEEIFSRPEIAVGGVAAPVGLATPSEGDLLVSGRWAWGSGTQHCDWIVGGARIEGGDGPKRAPVIAFFPRSEVVFHDTWHVSGLCGTGSTDFEVMEARVPNGRWATLLQGAPEIDRPLYRFPRFGHLALGVAAVALGLGRRAVAELQSLAVEKSYAGSRRTLAQRPSIQQQVAESETGLAAAWSLIAEATETVRAKCETGAVSEQDKALLRGAATFATEQARAAVDRMYHAGGGASVFKTSPLQRVFRDLHVATQHQMVAPRTWELLGRLSLGLETETSQL